MVGCIFCMLSVMSTRAESPIFTIDVAHPPLPQQAVENLLLRTVSQLSNHPNTRVLKIIHGYGSSGKGGKTKEVVLNWTFRNKSRFRKVLKGEEYTPFNREVQEMRTEVGLFEDVDLRTPNPGITICWLK